jgi:hypothetical protein
LQHYIRPHLLNKPIGADTGGGVVAVRVKVKSPVPSVGLMAYALLIFTAEGIKTNDASSK